MRDLSSLTRDWTHVPCIGRLILYHWTTREVPSAMVLMGVEQWVRPHQLISVFKVSQWPWGREETIRSQSELWETTWEGFSIAKKERWKTRMVMKKVLESKLIQGVFEGSRVNRMCWWIKKWDVGKKKRNQSFLLGFWLKNWVYIVRLLG